MKPKYRLRIFYWNPNGTNDAEVVDCKTLRVIDTLPEAFFGIKISGEYEFINPLWALTKAAVSPMSDGSQTLELISKYFKGVRK